MAIKDTCLLNEADRSTVVVVESPPARLAYQVGMCWRSIQQQAPLPPTSNQDKRLEGENSLPFSILHTYYWLHSLITVTCLYPTLDAWYSKSKAH